MSNFTPQVSHSVDFEGDKVSMSLKRLKRKSMMELSPYMSEDGKGCVDNMGMMNVSANFLPQYVKDFKGLRDADGNALTIKDVVDESYFTGLASDIIVKLFEISKMSGNDEKNSDKQPNMSIAEPETLEEES